MKKLFIYFVLIMTGCMEQNDTVKMNEELLNTDIEFARTSAEIGAAEAFNLYLADDALQLPNGADPIKGRDEIYNSMKAGGDDAVLEWEPQVAEVSTDGSMGWTWGKYRVTIKKDDTLSYSYGKYLNVWKKDSEGKWKVAVDLGNKSPEPESK